MRRVEEGENEVRLCIGSTRVHKRRELLHRFVVVLRIRNLVEDLYELVGWIWIEARARQEERLVAVPLQHLERVRGHARLDERKEFLAIGGVYEPEDACLGHMPCADVQP